VPITESGTFFSMAEKGDKEAAIVWT